VHHDHSYGGYGDGGFNQGLLLGAVMGSIQSHDAAAYAYSQQNNPDYIAWHQEEVAKAANDAALRQRLADLDAQVAGMKGAQGNVMPDVASAAPHQAHGGHGGAIVVELLFSLLLVGLLAAAGIYALRRHTRRTGISGAVQAPRADITGGSSSTKGETFSPLEIGIGSVVSMPLQAAALAAVDEAVFPEVTGTQVVTAVGSFSLLGVKGWNFYLNDKSTYLQVFENGEATLLSTAVMKDIDQVGAEYLLDDRTGLVGRSWFEDAAGNRYDRDWVTVRPGATDRVPPITLREDIVSDEGRMVMTREVMNYTRTVGGLTETALLSVSSEDLVDGEMVAFFSLDIGARLSGAGSDLRKIVTTA